jgi:sec-independent protein translocase protein TatA
MGEFSAWHLLIIAGVFVLLFGYKRLPDGARSLGRSLRIFKSEVKTPVAATTSAPSETPAATPVAPADASQPASTLGERPGPV